MNVICPACGKRMHVSSDGHWAHPNGLWFTTMHEMQFLSIDEFFAVYNEETGILPFEIDEINNFGDTE